MDCIVFTGGGTGGHVFPGIAVYQYLAVPVQQRVLWICSHRGVETGALRNAGIDYRTIATGKLRRYVDIRNLFDLGRVVLGFFQARAILLKTRPRVVFSKGGFVAVPVALAARSLGIPLCIHESDTSPGLATRITAFFATTIFAGYEDLRHSLPRRIASRVVVTGNPVRRAFFEADPTVALHGLDIAVEDVPVLLVTGGSLGARQLNELVAEIIGDLSRRCIVIHQTGTQGISRSTEIGEPALPGRYYAAPTFSDRFPALLRRATVVVARAGAGTIEELAATGTPSILVPLSTRASRGDQIENAEKYAAAGAARVLSADTVTATELLGTIEDLLGNRDELERMARAARSYSRGNAARTVATRLSEFCGDRDR